MAGLRRQLLGPLLLLSALLLGGQLVALELRNNSTIRTQSSESARRLASALILAIDSVADKQDLFRVVSATAAERDVDALAVVIGAPPTVLSGSRSSWKGKTLASLQHELGSVSHLIRQCLDTRTEQINEQNNHLQLAQPFEIGNAYLGLPAHTRGCAVVVLDQAPLIAQQGRLTLESELGAAATLPVAVLVLTELLRRRVLQPLSALAALTEGDTQPLPPSTAVEIRKVEQTLNERLHHILSERARYDSVIAQASDGFLICNENGGIEHANFAAMAPCGFGPTANNLDEALEYEVLAAFNRGEPEVLLSRRHAVGATVSLVLSRYWLTGSTPRSQVVIVRDISRQVATEALLTDAAEAARHTAALKSEFVATVSHELRTPLTAIRGSIDLLCSGVLGELSAPTMDLAKTAQRNVQRLSALVNDLLDLERIDTGRFQIAASLQDLTGLLHNTHQTLQPYAAQYQVALALTTPPAPAYAWVDPTRFDQIVNNLVSNAIKFSPAGSKVEITLQRHADAWRLSVIDQGDGIPDTFRPRIFSRFAQADSSDKRQKGGTGLGLAISKALAIAMDGNLDFESKKGQGSTFFLDLPVFTEPPSEAPLAAHPNHIDDAG